MHFYPSEHMAKIVKFVSSSNQVAGYQTAQYVAGPTRNNVPQQQAKAVVASAPYNANQAYPAQAAYQQNPQANAQPKRKQTFFCV